jgi:hypothetical protein
MAPSSGLGDANGHAVDDRHTNWAWGEPDDFFGQDCGVIVTSSGEWRDENCNDPRPFICRRQLE